MRYAEPVGFCKVNKTYDVETGNYIEDEPEVTTAYASIISTDIEMMQIVYGALRQGSLTLQFQNHQGTDFDYLEIRGKRYKVDSRDQKAVKEVFIVSEVLG